MRIYLSNKIFAVIIYILYSSFIYAHGNLSIRILEKTEEIKQSPKNAKLYFERGFLYQQHEEFKNAISDYLKSEELGFTNKLLFYRKAQAYYRNSNYPLALQSTSLYLNDANSDVKTRKLHAQILVKLNKHQQAINHYYYFLNHVKDASPRDYIEYSQIFLAINNSDFHNALNSINQGLDKIGKDTFSLQLKKLEYLEASNQLDETIDQYNYFILTQNRQEFWHYRKALYLYKNKKNNDCKIALEFSKASVSMLSEKFQKTVAIKNLNKKVLKLEKKVIDEN